jgi:acetyltransferase-like isoleucine patch superfamily enzyme
MLRTPVALKSCIRLDPSAELIKDGNFYSFSRIDRKINKSSIVFLDSYNQPLLNSLDESVACIILQKGADLKPLKKKKIGILLCDNPESLFYKIHETCVDQDCYQDLIEDSKISASARISSKTLIEKNVIIGDNTIIEDGVIIHSNVIIGSNCHISSGSIIGSSGFITYQDGGINLPVRSVGGVLIGNNVVIRSGTNINKSTFSDFSVISDNVIIDSLILDMIALLEIIP